MQRQARGHGLAPTLLEEAAWGEEGEAALSWAVLVEAEAAKEVEGGALVDGVQAVAEEAAACSRIVVVEAESAACTRAIRRRGRTSVPWRRSHAGIAGDVQRQIGRADARHRRGMAQGCGHSHLHPLAPPWRRLVLDELQTCLCTGLMADNPRVRGGRGATTKGRWRSYPCRRCEMRRECGRGPRTWRARRAARRQGTLPE